MKKTILLLFVSTLLISCDNNKNTVDNSDPMSGVIVGNDEKSEAMLQFTQAYQDNNIATVKSLFTEDVVFNVNDAKLTFDEVDAAFSSGHDFFNDIKHSEYDIATMYYNSGEVFTNYWYTWTATSKNTGDVLSLKGYCWFKWQGDKVVEVYNAFDPTVYNATISN